jgi:hypothetical protein
MSDLKPRRVKAKISRVVTEVVIVLLDKDGDIEEVEEILDEYGSEEETIMSIRSVLSVHP